MRQTKPSASSRSKKRKKSLQNKANLLDSSSSSTFDFSHSSEDLKSLADFCTAFEFTEMDFSEWEECDEKLDLTVQIWLSPQDIFLEAERNIEFVRTIRLAPKGKVVHEKVNMPIRVGPESHRKTRMVFQGQGDQCGGKSGDLIVIINRKT